MVEIESSRDFFQNARNAKVRICPIEVKSALNSGACALAPHPNTKNSKNTETQINTTNRIKFADAMIPVLRAMF